MPERATKGPRRLGAVREHGAAWEEPRVERARAQALLAMGRSARGGVSCRAASWGESAEVGRIEAEWFAWFVERPHGIPSPDPVGGPGRPGLGPPGCAAVCSRLCRVDAGGGGSGGSGGRAARPVEPVTPGAGQPGQEGQEGQDELAPLWWLFRGVGEQG